MSAVTRACSGVLEKPQHSRNGNCLDNAAMKSFFAFDRSDIRLKLNGLNPVQNAHKSL
ncbi:MULTISPECIES: hypothetical protein [unclassified Mesorhizobium]|uniref:hypothetical protein n=1 Tax=unclassified Mesorhizobium TaxID=325217 RepID=UPI00167C1F3E|nr:MULTISPECIES: hypothetical protein [unclassified Mesorhizobium]